MPWYSSAALKLINGSQNIRNTMLLWIVVPATYLSGHSYIKLMRAKTMLMVWRMGTGLTAPSKFLVEKSQKILGQK